jgi:hypothetical protein
LLFFDQARQGGLAIVRERDGVLTTLMRFAWRGPRPRRRRHRNREGPQPTRSAGAVIEELTREWAPISTRTATARVGADQHKDRYRARLNRVVARKRKGETIKTPPVDQPEPAFDLMAAFANAVEPEPALP